MHMFDLFPEAAFEEALYAGFISVTPHPELPIATANYTDKAVLNNHWTAVTSRCRGLVFNIYSHEVIASGPGKFHNYDKNIHADLKPSDLCFVTDKVDGSLGIGWSFGEHVGIATRGSFDGEQALHATALLTDTMRESIVNSRKADKPSSIIVEIVYPENKVIVDYGHADALIHLGVVDHATGLIVERPADLYVGDGAMTLAEALALSIADDAEGYVLDMVNAELETVAHVKLKGATYRNLHAAQSDLTEARVFEAMQSDTLDLLLASLPDETHAWVREVRDRIVSASQAVYGAALNAAIVTKLQNAERKEQAVFINKNFPEIRSGVFLALDENWPKLTAWVADQVKPGQVPFKAEELAL